MKWLGPVLVVALAVLAEFSLGRANGGPEVALFFGRFHPLLVHLPIGFFLLLALGEGATFVPRWRPRVEPAVGLLLPLSALAALVAFVMGQLLALEGGYPAAALGWHRRLTLLAVLGISTCWVLYERLRQTAEHGRLAYRGALVITLGLLSLGAHFGGTMTRGESYLSKYAPEALKPLLGGAANASAGRETATKAPSAASSEPLVFEDVVQPILNNYCFECHGTEKQKGKLRVDSLQLISAGGESGAVLVPGDPGKSPLLSRLLLPAADDERMPPEGKPGPKPEELALIEFWIARGASPSLKVRDVLAPLASRSLLERSLGGASSPSALPNAVALPSASASPSGASPASSSASASTSPSGASPASTSPSGASPASATASGASPAEPRPEAVAKASAGTPAASAPSPPPASIVRSGPAFLATYCEKCHGGAKQKGKLRVDSMAALLRGGAGGPALVPGKPEASSLVQRLRLPLDDDEHMPPKKEPQPQAAEIAVLAAWVRSGASSPAPTAAQTPPQTPPQSPPQTPPTQPASVPQPSALPPSAEPTPTELVQLTPTALVHSPATPRAVSFVAIQTLFRDKCGKCHIREKPAGGLGVERHSQLLEGGYSGAGIVPRDRKASVIMQRLLLPDSHDEHMPPTDEPALSAEELQLVGAWIDEGAPASPATATEPARPRAPEPLASKSGGCAACSVPGAPSSKWLALQSSVLLASLVLLKVRRRPRPRPLRAASRR
ncbi:MAG: hypothetical protein EOO73_18990 [Myxococcales bacterium]|nr:MAG: hypothetical protein EOO73_18990 [Myxococcales bacterium]